MFTSRPRTTTLLSGLPAIGNIVRQPPMTIPCILIGLIVLTSAPSPLSAGTIGVGSFSAAARVVTYDNVNVGPGSGWGNLGGGFYLSEDPLVISGDTYSTDIDPHLIYNNPEFVFGVGGGALATDAGHEVTHIKLGSPAEMAGIEITAGFAWSATVDFYDGSNNLLGVDSESGNGSGAVAFAGWQSTAGMIARIDIQDTSAGAHPMFFKDLTTETPTATAVPEPSGLTISACGCLVFAFGWLSHRCGQSRFGDAWRRSTDWAS